MMTLFVPYKNTRQAWLMVMSILLSVGLITPAHAEDIELVFGVYTSKKPTEMVKQYRPLLNALEVALSPAIGKTVKIRMEVSKTYEEGIKSLVEGTVDFSQVGPVSYVEVKDKSPGSEVLAIEGLNGQKSVQGVICVLSNAAVQVLNDLKGKKFAFGDQFSTTGRYNSQLYLVENGITGKDLAGFDYLERHDRVGAAVAGGDYDAGALNERTFRKLVETGSPLRALARFPIDGRPWVARSGLDPATKTALKKALTEIKDAKLLSALGEEGLTLLEGGDADYAATRKAVKENHRFTP